MPLTASPADTSAVTGSFTEEQAQLLRTGLRFVRSSVLMEIQEPTGENVSRRERRMSEVEELERKLDAMAR